MVTLTRVQKRASLLNFAVANDVLADIDETGRGIQVAMRNERVCVWSYELTGGYQRLVNIF